MNRNLVEDIYKLLLLKSNGWAIDKMNEEIFDTIFANYRIEE